MKKRPASPPRPAGKANSFPLPTEKERAEAEEAAKRFCPFCGHVPHGKKRAR